MKKPGSCDVPLPVRAVIIAFRSLLGCRWTQISALLDISEDTARKLYQRTEALAGALDTNTQYPILETALFYHLLPHIEPLNEARAHPSQLRRVEPGSEESISLRNDVLKHRTWNRTIAANHERKRKALAPLDGNTIRRVCLDQAEAQQWQVEEKVIIIGVDEYMLTFGGSGNENISALEGEDIYKFAQNVQEKRFKLMQWGAASATLADPTYPYPHSVWEAESPELKKELAHKLEQQVKKLRLAVDRQRENALIPGTIEHAHLARLNAEIDTHNKQLPHRQRIGRRKKMTPARAFVYEEYSAI
ncbi:hypothetical protein GQ44DRAFT_725899 [Phaeosphaeriaceae sp. PMI808]|nr:hypothetical protein GQ44DRAFT_725899 [Phaeosphaeriaceae sp. PMI808]